MWEDIHRKVFGNSLILEKIVGNFNVEEIKEDSSTILNLACLNKTTFTAFKSDPKLNELVRFCVKVANGKSILQAAVEIGSFRIVKRIKSNAPSWHLYTDCLFRAAKHKHLEILNYMLDCGNYWTWTAPYSGGFINLLHYYMHHQEYDTVRLVYKALCNHMYYSNYFYIYTKTILFKENCLEQFKFFFGELKMDLQSIVGYAIREHATDEIMDYLYDCNALHLCSCCYEDYLQDYTMIRLLLRKRPELTVTLLDVVKAKELLNVTMVKETLYFLVKQKNRDVNETDENGTTALMIAAHKGYPEIMETLIELGADVNIRDKWRGTAFFYVHSFKEAMILNDHQRYKVMIPDS